MTAKQATTLEDEILLEEAEDFKLPSDGYHDANLSGAVFAPTKKALERGDDESQFTLTLVLSEDDPDAPNLPLRYYLGWPRPEDKDIMWGTRTAWGAKIKAIKDALTAFGGQESGAVSLDAVKTFFAEKEGQVVKVYIKQALSEQTGEMQANVRRLVPA